MKSLTVRLPESLIAELDAESRQRKISKSDIIRERLLNSRDNIDSKPAALAAISDLIGSIEGLPSDLSSHKKTYLRSSNYGRNRSR